MKGMGVCLGIYTLCIYNEKRVAVVIGQVHVADNGDNGAGYTSDTARAFTATRYM